MDIEVVKLALRLTTNAFNSEIQMYIDACVEDLKTSGLEVVEVTNPQVQTAVIMYVKSYFEKDRTEQYTKSYESLRLKLVLSQEITAESETESEVESEQTE